MESPAHSEQDTRATVTTVVVEEEIYVVTQQPWRPRVGIGATLAWMLLDRVRSMSALLVIAVFVLTFLVQPFRIPSESMERTLLVGDFLLVNKSVYGPAGKWGWLLPYREPLRDDIVVFRFPLDPDEHVIKRVIGTDGDGLHLRDGVVYRNGLPLTEPYTAQPPNAFHSGHVDVFRDDFPVAQFVDPGVDAHWWSFVHKGLVHGDVVVPPRQYFVLGDNRNDSRDSRYWGFVPRANMVGLPVLIYFSVREPSRSDPPSSQSSPQPSPQNDKLGKSEGSGLLDFARWDRTLRVVH